jgi:hypothetical protein
MLDREPCRLITPGPMIPLYPSDYAWISSETSLVRQCVFLLHGVLDIPDLSRYMLKSLIYHLLDPSFCRFIQSSPWTTCLVAPILLLLLLQRLNLLVQISQPFLA